MQSQTIGNLALALSKAQSQMSLAQKTAENPHLRNRYADLASVWDACRDALTKNELSLAQLPSTEFVDGQLIVTLNSVLMHSSGEYVTSCMSATAAGNRGVNDLQAMGSVITYLRRYALSSMVGVSTGDDDDGASVSQEQVRPHGKRPSAPVPQVSNEQPAPAPKPTAAIEAEVKAANTLTEWATATYQLQDVGNAFENAGRVADWYKYAVGDFDKSHNGKVLTALRVYTNAIADGASKSSAASRSKAKFAELVQPAEPEGDDVAHDEMVTDLFGEKRAAPVVAGAYQE